MANLSQARQSKTWKKDIKRMVVTLRKVQDSGNRVSVKTLSRFGKYSDTTKRTVIGNFTRGLYN